MTFDEIVGMIINSFNSYYYSGTKDIKEKVLECATQIYVEQMKSKEDKKK